MTRTRLSAPCRARSPRTTRRTTSGSNVRPAPTLISNGFTDDLFPVDEAVRYANKVFSKYPRAPISQLHFDFGHPRGQNKAADTAPAPEAHP